MQTYFSLLDDASVFYLLIRVHYEDLMNLCKAYNSLWKLVCTPHFQIEWKAYNIQTVETPLINGLITVELDRLHKAHGRVREYKNNRLYKESIYINDVEQYRQIHGFGHIETSTYSYIGDTEYKTVIREYHNGEWSQICYKDNIPSGLCQYYDKDQCWFWKTFVDGNMHGLYVSFHPNGGLMHLGKYNLGELKEKIDY